MSHDLGVTGLGRHWAAEGELGKVLDVHSLCAQTYAGKLSGADAREI